MAWEPKDPWGGSGQDPLDEALRKAQDSNQRILFQEKVLNLSSIS